MTPSCYNKSKSFSFWSSLHCLQANCCFTSVVQELLYNNTFAWYEDHARMAEYVMSSPLLTGDADGGVNADPIVPKQPDGPVSALSTSRTDVNPPAARPPSAAESLLRSTSRQETATPHSERAEGAKKYRYLPYMVCGLQW